MTLRTPTYPESGSFQSKLTFDREVTILTGETISSEADLGGANIICISTPSGLIGSYLYFYIWDGTEFKQAYSPSLTSDIQMKIKVLPSVAYPMVPIDGAAFQKIKLVSDTTQTSDVTIKLICRNL